MGIFNRNKAYVPEELVNILHVVDPTHPHGGYLEVLGHYEVETEATADVPHAAAQPRVDAIYGQPMTDAEVRQQLVGHDVHNPRQVLRGGRVAVRNSTLFGYDSPGANQTGVERI